MVNRNKTKIATFNRVLHYNVYYQGYGKRHIENRLHKSNPIFVSREPLLTADSNEVTSKITRIHSSPPESTVQTNHFHHRRFPKHHQPPKIPCASTFDNYHRLDVYLEKKKDAQSQSLLAFESELFKSPSQSKRVASEPYRQRCAHPWRYFFTRRNYHTCTEQFRRSKTSCIDLSRY